MILEGRNLPENFLTSAPGDLATGHTHPLGFHQSRGIKDYCGQRSGGQPDSSGLELIARACEALSMKFDRHGRLFSTNHGMDRGSFNANSPDSFN